VVYSILLCIIDIILVHDIVVELGNVFIYLVAQVLYCNVFGLLFLFAPHGSFSHLSHSFLQCISSCLHRSNLFRCLLLPCLVRPCFHYQVGYMGRLVSKVSHHLWLEVVNVANLSANALLAVVHFLAPSTKHFKSFCDGCCPLLQSMFYFAPEVS
jgi:hypothetical protein